MQIKFHPDQNHQRSAWESAVGVFDGQKSHKGIFDMPSLQNSGGLEDQWSEQSNMGHANRLCISDNKIRDNIKNIQLANGLKQTQESDSRIFTIEMETGTGKTYVYLRSIYEMSILYGFTKFIIVVPSIAVKEGVYKSLQMTEAHFKKLYSNIPCDYFIYDSAHLGKVRNFATSDYIQIMVINIQAFSKSFTDPAKADTANIIHRWNDSMQGVPIKFIQSTNPIIIIDEPQSVGNTPKSKVAIQSLNPLATFRYSATHIDKQNMLYRLDSVDSYEKKLVKQIEVGSVETRDHHNQAYIKLLAVDNTKGFRAKIELDIQMSGGIKRKQKWVKQNDDLYKISGGREVYNGYIISDIYCMEGNEYIDFTSRDDIIKLGASIGDADDDEYKRIQIRKTIEAHLDKELHLTKRGIKVLSLFFIDKVVNYRDYTAPNQKGKYAVMFEEEYKNTIKKPKYATLFNDVDIETLAENVHNGYFSEDKNKPKDTKGNSKADEDTYALIMKDKEKLLSFDSKLKFIFSHSALKEGWDNPNVFQICTLNETYSVIKRRQEIGRGLRICVNQKGKRVHGFAVNRLTVIANESYKDFVEGLQKEIEEEEGIRFGIIEYHLFANINTKDESGNSAYFGTIASKKVWKFLYKKDYIDKDGKVTDKLKTDIEHNRVELPKAYMAQWEAIKAVLRKFASGLNIKKMGQLEVVKPNKAVLLSPEFKQLWDRIKYKTTYNVQFDDRKLTKKCAEAIQQELSVSESKLVFTKTKVKLGRGGVSATKIKESSYIYDDDYQIPDILSHLQAETNLKRKSIFDILDQSNRLKDFKINPQGFMDEVKKIIKRTMQNFIVDGIKYRKIGDKDFYSQELFRENELIGYLGENMMEATKSVYHHVIYDSTVEQHFAEELENQEEVKLYTKLPAWFKISTPIGSYNPDWAVLLEVDGKQGLYFVVESKGSLVDLRDSEKAKTHCGEEHFKALGDGAEYMVVDSYERFINKALGDSVAD